MQLLSRINTLNGQVVRGVNPVGEEKVYDGKDLPESKQICFGLSVCRFVRAVTDKNTDQKSRRI